MTVLLTGADGYLGWPTALRLADRLDERIVCVDNFARDAVGSPSRGASLRDAGREPRGAIRRGGEPESRGRRPGRPRLRTPAVGDDVRAGHRAARGRAAERALLVDQRRARAVHPAEQRLDEPQPASRARRVRARRHALHRDDDDGHLRRPALPDPGGGYGGRAEGR